MTILNDFLSLIYPQICMACGNNLFKYEECICTSCLFHLPKTNFHLEKDNPVSKLFWGKIKLESVAAYYYFNKGSKVQHLIHQLKYKGHKEIGVTIGKLYGMDLKTSQLFNDIDAIIPVPLHFKKQKRRGYNQSLLIAEGLSKAMQVDVNTDTLFRKVASETQTKKSQFKRWENVKEIFDISDNHSLENKKVLLVDDVITTGSTIEACANALNKTPEIKISVVALACTVY